MVSSGAEIAPRGLVMLNPFTKNRRHAGVVIPPAGLTPCGRITATPEQFYESGCEEARRLVSDLGLSDTSNILDIGCGVGRLPVGLMALAPPFRSYLGIDVDGRRIAWCRKHLARRDPRLRFVFLDMPNARYNPTGRSSLDIGHSPLRFEVIYAYSVFSHLLQPDAESYLYLFRERLAPGGVIFLTLFVADVAAPCTENPPDFGVLEWRGNLHCVLYSLRNWHEMISRAGLRTLKIVPDVNIDGQTAYYLCLP